MGDGPSFFSDRGLKKLAAPVEGNFLEGLLVFLHHAILKRRHRLGLVA
jgi:hypothetical protein